MKQVILATGGFSLGSLVDTKATFCYLNSSNVLTKADSSNKIKKNGFLVLSRTEANGGDVVVPIFNKDLSVVKQAYDAGEKFQVEVDLTGLTITPGYDYTIIIAKKGVNFNERNKWTFTTRAGDATTAADIAKLLVDFVNANKELGITAGIDNDEDTLVYLDAKDYNTSFVVLTADHLPSVISGSPVVSITQSTEYRFGSVEEVKDLFEKGAADQGFEYTYVEGPMYKALEGAGPNLSAFASGANIFTLRFTEPRQTRTTDDLVYQLVHIVVPANDTTTVDNILALFE